MIPLKPFGALNGAGLIVMLGTAFGVGLTQEEANAVMSLMGGIGCVLNMGLALFLNRKKGDAPARQAGFMKVSAMPFLAAAVIVATAALASCASFDRAFNSPLPALIMEASVKGEALSFIDSSDDPKVAREELRKVFTDMQTFLYSGEVSTVGMLESALRARLDEANLPPHRYVWADAAISGLVAVMGDSVSSGDIPEDFTIRINRVLQWVVEATYIGAEG